MECTAQIQIVVYAFWLVLIVCTAIFIITMAKLFFQDKYTDFLEQQLKEYRENEQKDDKES